MHGNVLDQLLKLLAAGNEIAFAIDLDKDADFSAVTRPAFLPAWAIPFLRRISIAATSSPRASTNAFLQSIIPAPVFSRSDLTPLAVTSAITYSK
jgi:hypothetical protein